MPYQNAKRGGIIAGMGRTREHLGGKKKSDIWISRFFFGALRGLGWRFEDARLRVGERSRERRRERSRLSRRPPRRSSRRHGWRPWRRCRFEGRSSRPFPFAFCLTACSFILFPPFVFPPSSTDVAFSLKAAARRSSDSNLNRVRMSTPI